MTKEELITENERLRQALHNIVDAGSRQVWQSYGNEDGTYTKTLVKVDMSIEATMALDALDKDAQ